MGTIIKKLINVGVPVGASFYTIHIYAADFANITQLYGYLINMAVFILWMFIMILLNLLMEL